jgi:Tfp pilus assembly protein PilN
MDLSTFTQLLQLGWPAIVTVAFAIVAREYMRQMDDQVAYLRKRIDILEEKQKAALERMG